MICGYQLPVSRVAIFLNSSFSLADIVFSLSSSARIFRKEISPSNLIFHSVNDLTVTGVPRVRASSSYNNLASW